MSRIDDLYARFEARFRGSREAILQRLTQYGPLLSALEAHHATPTAIDCGSGRGEWLELLTRRGWLATGVDTNPQMLAEAEALDLDTRAGDAVDYLSSLEDRSVVLISAFHLVEHLPTARLLVLLQEMARVVAVNGVVILETPNPENLMVGTSTFFMDPTHEKPIPPPLLQFYVEQSGVGVTRIVRINGEERAANEPTLESALRPLLFSALDYAIVGVQSPDSTLLASVGAFVESLGEASPIDLHDVRALDDAVRIERQHLAEAVAFQETLRSAVLESRDALHAATLAVFKTTQPLLERVNAVDAAVEMLRGDVHRSGQALLESDRAIHASNDAIHQAGIAALAATQAVETAVDAIQTRVSVLDALNHEKAARDERRFEALDDRFDQLAGSVHSTMALVGEVEERQRHQEHASRQAVEERISSLEKRLERQQRDIVEAATRTSRALEMQADTFQGALREAMTMTRRTSDAFEFRIINALESLRRVNSDALVDRQSRKSDDERVEALRRIEEAVRETTERVASVYTTSTSWRVTAPLRTVSRWVGRLRGTTPTRSPVTRGLLANPLIWKVGKLVARRIPGLRGPILRSLNRKKLLGRALADGPHGALAAIPIYRDTEEDRLTDEQRIALLPRDARRLYYRMNEAGSAPRKDA